MSISDDDSARRVGGRRRRLACLAGAALVVMVAGGCIGDLGTLPGTYYAHALDINDHGVTVGFSLGPDSLNGRAFRQQPGGPLVDLNGDFEYSVAEAVNGSGVVVGHAGNGGSPRAMRWDADGVAYDLGAGPESYATDINDAGTIVGRRLGGSTRGFVRDALTGQITDLPAAFPENHDPTQRVTAINNNGDIVGYEAHDGREVPVMWSGPDHTPEVLPYDPEYRFYRPADISDDGTIVGTQSLAGVGIFAVFWSGPTHERVVITEAGNRAYASGVNVEGEIVGRVERADGSTWAFFRDPDTGELIDLGGLGGPSAEASCINAAGQAAGGADTRQTTETGRPIRHAVVFGTPDHEP